MPILLKLHGCFGHGHGRAFDLDIIIRLIVALFPQFELSLFQALLLLTYMYVDNGYLVRINPPINF